MIIIKTEKEIDLMRQAGKIVAETLLLVEKEVKPGVTTAELDRIAEEFITKHGARPSFKGLYGFPASLTISFAMLSLSFSITYLSTGCNLIL